MQKITKSQQRRYNVIKQFLTKQKYEKDVVLLSPNHLIKELTLIDVRQDSNGIYITTNNPGKQIIKFRDIYTLYMAIFSRKANNFESFLKNK